MGLDGDAICRVEVGQVESRQDADEARTGRLVATDLDAVDRLAMTIGSQGRTRSGAAVFPHPPFNPYVRFFPQTAYR